MKKALQNEAIAEALGWVKIHVEADEELPGRYGLEFDGWQTPTGSCVSWPPDCVDNPADLRKVEILLGLADKTKLELRVKWINNLRSVVGRGMPKNKGGVALVSDVDLLLASTSQRAEALIRTIGTWHQDEN